jgi:hypothetical protein
MRKLILQKNLNSKNPRNQIELVIEFMHGDADDFDENRLALFPIYDGFDPKDMESSIGPCDRGTLAEAYALLERLKADVDKYRYEVNPHKILVTIPGYETWFKPDPKYGYSDYWLMDSHSNGEYMARINDIKIFYYDNLGNKYGVSQGT